MMQYGLTLGNVLWQLLIIFGKGSTSLLVLSVLQSIYASDSEASANDFKQPQAVTATAFSVF